MSGGGWVAEIPHSGINGWSTFVLLEAIKVVPSGGLRLFWHEYNC
jgi:hypothetical protein